MGEERYRLSMSETISTSSSAAAIFSADDSCGRPPKRKDMVYGVDGFGKGMVDGYGKAGSM